MVVLSGNVYQMLKDHDLQVQEAVRRGYVDKAKVRKVDMEGNQLTTNLLFVSSCNSNLLFIICFPCSSQVRN